MSLVETELFFDFGRFESFCMFASGIEEFHQGLVVPCQFDLPTEPSRCKIVGSKNQAATRTP